MATKRVSEMTADEYAADKERRRAWRAKNPEKVIAERKRWRQSPAGKAAARRWQQKRREADPEAFRAKKRASTNASNARQRDQDYENFRAKRSASEARYRAGRTPEQRETRKALVRRKYWRMHPMSRAKVRETMAIAKSAIPGYVPPDVRDEVIQNLLMAISDGTVRLRDLAARAPEFLRAYNRQFDHHKVKSLDESIPGMKSSWLDALPDDAERF